MEEFNGPDIERYVRDTLEKDPTYQELQEMEDTIPDLVKDVVNAASGVFLWVYLVVQSLLDGLSNEDSIANLQKNPTASEDPEGILQVNLQPHRQVLHGTICPHLPRNTQGNNKFASLELLVR
jgi:hypothetical protein